MTNRWRVWGVALVVLASVCHPGCGAPSVAETADPAASAVAEPGPWPMFRGDPGHRGVAARQLDPAWRIRWKVDLGERVDASAVITGRNQAFVATRKGLVVLLDIATGASVVRRRLAGGVWSSPARVGPVLVVASRDQKVWGLDPRTLEPRWGAKAPSRSFSAITGNGSDVLVTSGRWLLALDSSTGRQRFRAPLDAVSYTAPAVDSARGLVVVGDRAGGVYAFDAVTGERRWRAETTAGVHNDGSPVIAGALVLIGSNDNGLHAFSLDAGNPVWVSRFDNWVVSTPAILDGVAYYGDDGGFLRAVDLASGSLRWTTRVDGDLASSPTIIGQRIVFGAHDQRLHNHARADGSSLPPIDAGANVFASPAVAGDGTIIVSTQLGRVWAID